MLRVLLIAHHTTDTAPLTVQLEQAFGEVQLIRVNQLAELMQALKSERFDLALISERGAGIYGTEALKRIRAALPWCPVLFVSAALVEDLKGPTGQAQANYPLAIAASLQQTVAPSATTPDQALPPESAIEQATEIIKQSPAVAFVWRNAPDWPIIHVSENVQQFGFDSHALISGNVPYSHLVHPQDLDSVREHAAAVRSAGDALYTQEYRLMAEDGSVFWVNERTWARQDAQGELTHFQGVVINITDRKRSEHALHESEARYQQLFEMERDAIFLVDNATGDILEANPAASRLYGYSREQMLQRKNTDLSAEPHATSHAVRSRSLAVPVRYHRRKDGSVFPVEISGSHFSYQGRSVHIAAVRDISERIEAEKELHRLSLVVEQSPSLVVLTDTQRRIVYVNRRFETVTGYRFREVQGRPLESLIIDHAQGSSSDQLWRSVEQQDHWQGELQSRRKDGGHYWELASIAPIKDQFGTVTHFVKLSEDISEQKAMSKRLEFMAFHDPLTGLPNRAQLLTRIDHAITLAKREQKACALLFIDLDNFKVINDSLGHAAGDQLLIGVANRLRQQLREADSVARFGGDEFVILLSQLDSGDGAAVVAQKVLDALSEPFKVAAQDVFSGGSIGISVFPTDAEESETLVQHADAAMYLAKEQGRNVYRFFTAQLHQQVRERLSLEDDMRRALEQQAFGLRYQARFDAQGQRVTALETLLCWKHPKLGMISPSRFVPVAEATGLIHQLGAHALHQACQQQQRWQQQGLTGLAVAVSLSPKQLQQASIVEQVRSILAQGTLPADQLELELSLSTVAASQVSEAEQILYALKQLGVWISVDDFASTPISLRQFKRLPIDLIKLGPWLLEGATSNDPKRDSHAAMIRSTVALAHDLGRKVVAKGVACNAQRQFLASLGCDELAGPLFGEPLSASELGP